jgi:hypothetical protein
VEEIGVYLKWLESGRGPDDIKKDLMKRGFGEQDAYEIMVYIDNLHLSNKIEKKAGQDGSAYKIVGWILVCATIAISIGTFWYASMYGGWIVLIGGGGGGFSLIRYGHYLESKNVIKRNRGFPRKFQRKR